MSISEVDAEHALMIDEDGGDFDERERDGEVVRLKEREESLCEVRLGRKSEGVGSVE